MNFLTVPEVAAKLNLSVAWVRRLCQQGRIQAMKAGRDWLIPEDSLDEYKPRKVGRPPKINFDKLTPKEAERLLNAMDDYFDHNEPDDEDIAEYERLEKIAHPPKTR